MEEVIFLIKWILCIHFLISKHIDVDVLDYEWIIGFSCVWEGKKYTNFEPKTRIALNNPM